MINDFDLTPNEIKQQYPEEVIKEAKTFRTHGVSELEADTYLKTPEGKKYVQRLFEADPHASNDEITTRAIGQIRSGTDLPRMEIMNEPMIKIVAHGKGVSDYTVFFGPESELHTASADGKNLSKYFALPAGSDGQQFDVYRIVPKQPTEVFISTVAPSTEFDGQVVKAGGATQYLTPNRALYEKPEFVTTVQNRIFIPHQKDLQIPSDLKNTTIQTIGGINRTELATMSDELIAKGYSQPKALEAVNARVAVSSALEELKTGRAIQLPDGFNHSLTTLRDAGVALKDSPQSLALGKQITAGTAWVNGDAGLAQTVLNAPAKATQPSSTFSIAHKDVNAPEPILPKRAIETSPPPTMSTHQAVTAEQSQRQAAELQEINRPVVAAEAQTRSAQAALQNQIKAESLKPHIPQAVKPITHVGAVEAVSKTPDISIKPTVPAVPTGLIGELADSPAVKLAGKAATPLAIAAGAYALGKQVSDGIANETTAQGKVSVGTSVAANTLLETGVGAVGAAYGTVEGWVVGAGDYGKNGLLGAAIGAGAGAKHRSTQLVADFKATSIENTIKTTAADWTDTGFKAYNGSTFEHTVNTVSTKTNAFIATSNQALNDVSNTISQTYQNSGAAPYVNRAAQFTEHATQSAAQAVKPATDYVSEKVDVAQEKLNGYWNRFTQTEIAQKLTNGYNKTVADTNQDLNRAGIPTGEPAAQTPAQPQAQPAPAPKPIEMGMGANGKGVKQVQQALNALGANIHTDGHFGKSTAQALQAFQRVHHRQLNVDGTVGDNDISVIHQALKRQANIKNGQSNLNELGADLKVNGRMDKATVAAVKEFQTEHHLKVTGALNNATQKTLGHEVQEQRQTHIKQIQTALNELGAELTVDGHIGKATVAAVKDFQTEHHLKATGKLDGNTINAMNQALQTQQQQQQSPARTTEPAQMQPSPATPNAAQPAVSPEQSKQVEQMVSALSSTPAFGALPPDVQKAMAAQMMEAAQAVSPQPQVPTQVQAPTPNNADTAILAPNAYTPPATQPVQMTARMADLHAQITQQFGDQLDHLSAKDKNSALAMTTQAAVSMSAKSIDYIHVNDEGKVLMGFNNNVGYSNSVNLNDAPKLDAQSVLADTVNLQQVQQADVAQRQMERQAHAGLGMSR